MRKVSNQFKGIVKGAPASVLVSVGVHALIIIFAIGFTVFRVLVKEPAQFVPPPPVEHPKMELKKPRVKVKREQNPQSTQRIVSKAVGSVPDLALPDLPGAADGLADDFGGYELTPNVSEMSIMGGTRSMGTGNEFEGTFYSLRYDRRGRIATRDVDEMYYPVRQFLENDWNPLAFARYYRSPQKLYANFFMVPAVISSIGPAQFGLENDLDFDPVFWLIHWRGKIKHNEGGQFRFWGVGEFQYVRVNGEVVFVGSRGSIRLETTDLKYPRNEEEAKYYDLGNMQAMVGDWFTLEPGEVVEMEMLSGENEGWRNTLFLMVEKKGEMYSKNVQGMPILPIFKTGEIPKSVKNQLEYMLIPGEVDLDGEVEFNVY